MVIIKKGIFIVLIFMLPLFGKDTDSTIIKDPKTAFLASFVPGGGQIYNGKLLKGLTVLGLEVLAMQSWLDNSKIYSDYDSGDYPLQKHRYLEKRNKYAWWIIFLYFYGMVDAMVDAHLSPFNEVMEVPIELEEQQGGENE